MATTAGVEQLVHSVFQLDYNYKSQLATIKMCHAEPKEDTLNMWKEAGETVLVCTLGEQPTSCHVLN